MSFHNHLKPIRHSFSGPVTALTVCSEKVLVGCGNDVSVYCLKNLDLQTRKQVLYGACIHGFSQGGFDADSGRLICVYGAKQTCIIALKTNGDNDIEVTVLSDIAHFPDWIWEARWVKHMNSAGTIAFALAHNTAILWEWGKNVISHHQDCIEKCILYCAHFIGSTWEDLVLAAGTVFNKVVLWLVSHNHNSSEEPSQSQAPVMHTFSGHKGVIFSIKYHSEHQRLCTVSDDRSIRMWQIEFPDGKSAMPTVNDWKCMKSSLLLSVFGHSARVWDAVLMTDYFASVGEDATSCIWDYSGQVILKFKGHKGKSIWSVAATEDEKHILTGGGDGSVRLWKINSGQGTSPLSQSLDVSKLLPVSEEDFPRIVTLLDHDSVLIMMNSGSLYSYMVSSHHFDCVFQDSRFTSYSIVSPCPDKRKVVVASIGGLIKVIQLISGSFHDAPAILESLFDGKILAVVWVSYERLIVSGPSGLCYILRVTENKNARDSTPFSIVQESSLQLPICKHRWISAACVIDSSTDTSTKLLICGDKDGTIYSYKVPLVMGYTCDVIQPSQCFNKIHGKNGVTFISFKDNVLYSVGRDGCCRHWGIENEQLVLLHGSKVVKGFEWIDKLEWNNEDLLFYGFFSTQFVIWSQHYNQKLFYVECGGGHRSWGCSYDYGAFRFAYLKGGVVHIMDSAECSMHEMLKPALHGRELHDVKLLEMSNECGVQPYFLTFTASEDTTINIGLFHTMKGFTHWKPLATLKGHLSSVRALALSCESPKASQQSSSHIDGQKFSDRDGLCIQSDFILFTGGGRAEIRVWKVRVRNSDSSEDNLNACEEGMRTNDECVKNNLGEIEDKSVQINSSKKAVVKQMDFISCTHQEWSTHYLGESRHKRPYSKWKARKLRLDPETRVMSLDATPVCKILPDRQEDNENNIALKDLHIVSAAGSDGLLRVFCYNDQRRKLTPIAQSAFHKGCVLKVLHFIFKSKDESLFLIFSTSTTGIIAVWLLDHIVRRAIDQEQNQLGQSRLVHTGKLCKDTEMTSHLDNCLSSPTEVKEGQGALFVDDGDDDFDWHASEKSSTYKDEDLDGVEDIKPLHSLPAHQSGINCVHAIQVNDTSLLLASGGDDNALTVQVIELKGRELKVKSVTTNTNAYSAQITGLRILSKRVLVSGSIDQRICVWNLDIREGDIKMALLSSCYIYLADVSCMEVCLYRNAVYMCLGGEGLCLYSWNLDHNTEKEKQTI